MTYELELKLAGLRGILKGIRGIAQAQVRINHTLARDWEHSAAGFAYKAGIPNLVAQLQNIRCAERKLDEIIKEVENAE